jgi:hypothetical protein
VQGLVCLWRKEDGRRMEGGWKEDEGGWKEDGRRMEGGWKEKQ